MKTFREFLRESEFPEEEIIGELEKKLPIYFSIDPATPSISQSQTYYHLEPTIKNLFRQIKDPATAEALWQKYAPQGMSYQRWLNAGSWAGD